MIYFTTIKPIRKLINQYHDLFNNCQYNSIATYFYFYLFSMKSLSQATRMCSFVTSHSSLCRQLKELDPQKTLRRHSKRLISKLRQKFGELNKNDFYFVVDDTDNPKYLSESDLSGIWGCSKGKYQGQKIFFLGIVHASSGQFWPITYRIISKNPQAPGVLLNALDCLQEALDLGFKAKYLTADSWFDSSVFAQSLQKLGIEYVWELKSNRKIKGCEEKTLKKLFSKRVMPQKIKVNIAGKAGIIWASEANLSLSGFSSPIKVVAYYNSKTDKEAFKFIACTEQQESGAKIWECSRLRWKIECFFRDCKSYLNFGRMPAGKEQGSHLAVVIPMILYTSMKLSHEEWGAKDSDTISQIVESWKNKTIMDGIMQSQNSLHFDALKLWRYRNSKEFLNRKPRNSPAGKIHPPAAA